MTSHPASAFLVSLLSSPSAQLTLSLPPARRATCAFYDEPLPLVLTLRLAPNALPAPKQASSSRRALPLPTLKPGLSLDDGDEEVDADDEEEEEESPLSMPPPASHSKRDVRVPTALHILLAHTRATAEAAYVSPGGASGGNAVQAPAFWKRDWAGNHTPSQVQDKEEVGVVRYEGKEGRWVVEWNVRAPIVYQRTPHPTPSLSLRATLTLTLNPNRLSLLLPTRTGPSLSASALFTHDLLSPLSEGPSYPDESAAERAARSEGHLARLSAASLPASALGAHIVTPLSGANALARRKAEEIRGRKEELDLGRARVETNASEEQGEMISGTQRYASLTMDVRSAINVRMRTVAAPCLAQRSSADDDDDAADEGVEEQDARALVLCVELENAASSGITFNLEGARIQVSGTPSPSTSLQGTCAFPLRVNPGAQHNLLYYVSFSSATLSAALASNTSFSAPSRAVSIILSGAPLGLAAFESSWNCTLDMTSLLDSSAAKADAEIGAGGVSFSHQGWTPTPIAPLTAGSVRLAPTSLARAAAEAASAALEQEARSNAKSTPPTLSLAPRRGTLSSTQQQQQRALPPLPRTPTSGLSTPRQPSPLPSGTNTPRSSSFSSAYQTPTQRGSLTARTPSGGVGLGLLAQARLRSGSAAYASVPYSARPASTPQQLVQSNAPASARPASAGPAALGWATLSSAPLSAWARVTGSNNSPSQHHPQQGGGGTPGSTNATLAPTSVLGTPATSFGARAFPRPGERDGMPQRAEVKPWNGAGAGGVPHREGQGLLITAKIRAAAREEEDEEEEGGESEASRRRGEVKALQVVKLDIVISNRSEAVRGAVLAWEDEGGLLGSLLEPSASGSGREEKVLDAEAAALKHLALRTAQDKSALLPLTTDVRVGPLPPGTSTLVTLPLLALAEGTHPLAPLCLIDVDTGVERVLRDLGNVVIVA